jgi:hypothetical protein
MSLPVLFFGDLFTANIATVGLNPSDQEYTTPDGQLLTGALQRFATLVSLGAGDRSRLTDAQCDSAIATMRGYFGPTKPVYAWFNALGRVLEGFGASFAAGSAAHLDLVQESTCPVWSQLQDAESATLLDQDLPFLEWQIRTFPLRVVLCNGRTVADAVFSKFGAEPRARGHVERLTWSIGSARVDGREVTFVGWNVPLARPTGLGTDGEVKFGRLLADQVRMISGFPGTAGLMKRPGRGGPRPAGDKVTALGGTMLRKVSKEQPIDRHEFERLLQDWIAHAGPHATIGDTSGRCQTAWIHVQSDGNLYYLNADSTKAAVDQYVGLLAIDPELPWTIVTNQRGRRNKVAFGRSGTVIPGFYFYVKT